MNPNIWPKVFTCPRCGWKGNGFCQSCLFKEATAADVGGLLARKAASPLLATKVQLPCDVGLFSDEADQLDLVEMFQDPAEDE